MKRFVVALFLLVSLSVKAQDIEPFLRGIADKIIEDSKVAFIDEKSGEIVEVQEDSTPRPGLAVGSSCAQWGYTSSMLCDGLNTLSKALNDEKYSQFVVRNHQFIFDNMEFIKRSSGKRKTRISTLNSVGRFGGVWSCGPQGGALLNSYLINQDPAFLDYVKNTAEHLEGIRQSEMADPEKQMSRKGLDGIYAYVATLARLGKVTGELHYFDTCVEMVKETELFYEPGYKLHAQAYYPDMEVTSNIFWLRGIGWTAVGLVELLSYLPENHPDYDEVLAIYQKLIIGVAQYQTANGLWRHLVNRADSFEETSGSIFVVYAFAKGLNEGWLPERYRDVAMAGWRGMMSKQTADGSIEGNTGSVRTSVSPAYHLNNSTKLTDAYLSGPLFLAGTEMLNLYENPAHRKTTTARWTFTHDPSAVNEATN